MNGLPVISILTLLPVAGGIALIFLRKEQREAAFSFALGISLAILVMAAGLWLSFAPASGLQFIERREWIPSIGAEYFVGVDGVSLLLVVLAALVGLMAVAASARMANATPGYFACILFLQAGLFGTFTALNFFHWFLFWEISLIPAFFLIKFWGGRQRSSAAAQFFVYTMAGSVAMLLSFMAVYLAAGSLDFIRLAEMGRSGELSAALNARLDWAGLPAGRIEFILFLGMFLGFAVKVPLFPFHTWLPGAYAEAPSTTTMLLTGAMSKMGVYGFLRILMPLFPEPMREALTPLLWLAVLTIVFSAFAAMAQTDLKRVLAYSSINHLGYCLLGVFAVMKWTDAGGAWAAERTAALNGVALQMFNHGLTAAALFCFVAFLEQRTDGRRGLDDFGGLRARVPVFCGLMGITLFASIGLPGLNGFIGEFLIFKGVFPFAPWAAALATIGLLGTAIFLLTLMQRVFHGEPNEKWPGLADLSMTERWTVGPAVVLMVLLGVWPQWLIAVTNPAVAALTEGIKP